ncbi:MAG: hypothetical protein IJV04_07360, partial [Lachnospiraceae bacterium]|nr:hypothetical protein [Lachnospiraceae bacterium]
MKKRPTIRSLFLSALSVAAGALVIVLAVWNIGASINLVQAADGEKKTKTGKMTYYHYTVELGNKIQPTTLFVGTYLISLKALNAMNYGEAL